VLFGGPADTHALADSRRPDALELDDPRLMANIAKWNIRLRHEWLQTPLKKKRIKRSQKIRIGLLDAENRKKVVDKNAPAPEKG
jgi:hypothetical protein